jgi:hypothetical protein
MLILVCGSSSGLYSFSLYLDSLRIHLRYLPCSKETTKPSDISLVLTSFHADFRSRALLATPFYAIDYLSWVAQNGIGRFTFRVELQDHHHSHLISSTRILVLNSTRRMVNDEKDHGNGFYSGSSSPSKTNVQSL